MLAEEGPFLRAAEAARRRGRFSLERELLNRRGCDVEATVGGPGVECLIPRRSPGPNMLPCSVGAWFPLGGRTQDATMFCRCVVLPWSMDPRCYRVPSMLEISPEYRSSMICTMFRWCLVPRRRTDTRCDHVVSVLGPPLEHR